ncbi:MAG: hypothetical protein HWE25_14760 [Alphaproteobacteria bacterium]|nr:hypothetical protein [Alphaproteobacteria bacterium]
MAWGELFDVVVAVIASLGGASVFIFALSNWLGKVWAARLMEQERAKYGMEIEKLKSELTLDTEAYKMKLKKSEFLFQKEFEAASAFVALKQKLSPKVRFPNMDYHDACDDVAREFSRYSRAVSEFLTIHGAVLSHEARELVQEILSITDYGKYEIAENEGTVSNESNNAADTLLTKMNDLEKMLVNKVVDQSVV